MALARGKRVALIGAAGAVAVLAAFAGSRATWILERWSIHRLGSGDLPARRAAVEQLARVGADASVGPLLETLAAPEIASEAADALGAALGRSRGATRRAAATALLDRVELSLDPNAARTVVSLGSEPGVVEECLSRLQATTEPAGVATGDGQQRVRAFAWILGAAISGSTGRGPGADPVLERLVPQLSATEVALICSETLPLGSAVRAFEGPVPGDPAALPRAVLARHPDREARAAALAALALLPPALRAAGVLESAYRADPALRSPALRLAGGIRCGAEDLDLLRILGEERDPVLLEEAIRARALQTQPLDRADLVLLTDGLPCPFPLPTPASAGSVPLEAAEVRRLEEILATRSEPDVRDAASLALALRHRAAAPPDGSDGPVGPGPGLAALSVHEWTLWEEAPPRRDPEGPAGSDDGDLPADVLAEVLAGVPADPAGEGLPEGRDGSVTDGAPPEGRLTLRTSVLLRAEAPSSVLVEAWIPRGGPTACAPEPTERRPFESGAPVTAPAAVTTQGAGSLRASLLAVTQARRASAGGAVVAGTAGRAPYRPPRTAVLAGNAGSAPYGPPGTSSRVVRAGSITVRSGVSGVLPAARFPAAPWAIALTGRSRDLDSVALEWCGVRVGHPPELEGPRAGGGGAGALEEPGALSIEVAIGGARHPGLSWEGEILHEPPFAVAWTDAGRTGLVIAVPRAMPAPSSARGPGSLYPPPGGSDSASPRCPGVFAIRRLEGEEAAGAFVEDLGPEAPRTVDLVRLPLRGEALESRIVEVLVSRGLEPGEARALQELARPSILAGPGTGVLAIVAPSVHERALPLRVAPAPRETVRVGVFVRRCEDLPVRDERWTRRLDLRPWRPTDLEIETSPVWIEWTSCGAPSASPLLREPAGGLILGGGFAAAALSWDGSVCVVVLREGGRTRVKILDFARGEIETWLDVPGLPPDWSSAGVWVSDDGARVALARRCPEGPVAWVLDRGRALLLVLPGAKAVDLSGDGKCLAFLGDDAIGVLDLDSRERRMFRAPAGFRVAGAPSLDGDGARVAFGARATDASAVREFGTDSDQAFVADLAGGLLVRIRGPEAPEAPHSEEWSAPRLARDGRTVAVRAEAGGDREVVVLDLLAGTADRIASIEDPDPQPLGLSADGRRLLVSLESELRVVDLPGGAARRVVTGARRAEGHVASISPDGKRVAVAREGSDGSRLHVVEVDGLQVLPVAPAAR